MKKVRAPTTLFTGACRIGLVSTGNGVVSRDAVYAQTFRQLRGRHESWNAARFRSKLFPGNALQAIGAAFCPAGLAWPRQRIVQMLSISRDTRARVAHCPRSTSAIQPQWPGWPLCLHSVSGYPRLILDRGALKSSIKGRVSFATEFTRDLTSRVKFVILRVQSPVLRGARRTKVNPFIRLFPSRPAWVREIRL